MTKQKDPRFPSWWVKRGTDEEELKLLEKHKRKTSEGLDSFHESHMNHPRKPGRKPNCEKPFKKRVDAFYKSARAF